MLLEVKEDGKKATLNLSKAFYPRKIVNKALKEVKGAKITKKESGRYFHITMKTEAVSAEKLTLEFCNYVLSLIKGASP
ncbi:MAG: HxsD-like protein [Candidatus Diapherotrites archaeon]|nr:HxsD-like protein [Candidatus Diapherotrites archaeon]